MYEWVVVEGAALQVEYGMLLAQFQHGPSLPCPAGLNDGNEGGKEASFLALVRRKVDQILTDTVKIIVSIHESAVKGIDEGNVTCSWLH